ncbi:serine hydrolase domain-containing protein [Candidatus Magnetomonas plexicatena]|uniref:serine hydrolase domain-containing protein n=1 Tax=Candidatus Magnetomonas plexicatena TaxID=2552947 RepID=UPI001C73FC15|nr:beta-lactamase family protein [Nitrospirales bacterium LBB_01]
MKRRSEKRARSRILAVLWLSLATVLMLSLLGCGSGSSSDTSGGSSYNSTLTDSQSTKIQTMITERTGNPSYENVPAMVMGIKQDNKTAWYGTAGYSDNSTLTPVKYTDKFRIGSISKTFTATVVLQLAQEGKLSLSDNVSSWLPTVASTLTNYSLGSITIKNLLNHTSGIHTYTDFTDSIFLAAYSNPYRIFTSSEVMSVINSHSPDFTVGTSWEYSNSNYYLLGLIIEAASGETYENQVQKRILTPLGMTSTEVPASGNPYISGSYAHGYMYDSTTSKMIERSDSDPSYPFASGSIVSNIPDLLKWMQALYNGTLLNSTYHALQMSSIDLSTYGMGNYNYGLGIMTEGDYNIIGHRGQIFAYDCSIQHYTTYDYDLAVCVNRSLFDENVTTYANTNSLILYDTLTVLAGSTVKPSTKQPVKRSNVRTPLTEY